MVDWARLARQGCAIGGTPSFLFSERAVQASWATLRAFQADIPIRLRHWLSLKTQPVARLLQVCRDYGIGIEVVSEFELAAVLAFGVPPAAILVNGVAKHHWLPKFHTNSLRVHAESLAEVDVLAGIANERGWRIGLRCAVPRRNTGGASSWDQFGMTAQEIQLAARRLTNAGIPVCGIHSHIHTNVAHASEYADALEHLQRACAEADLKPGYVDVGGGLPIPGERPLEGSAAETTFDLEEYRRVLQSIPDLFPSAHEIWLENGRFLTGAAGALVVTVLDKKERDGHTYLICDGGRVNHARLAATETHDLLLEPTRGGMETQTIICGPTCGAVDRLGSWRLPSSIAPGDRIVWLNAGAYHIPLETRFSFGLAPVIWFNEDDEPEIVRVRESPTEWWGQWVQVKGQEVVSC